jgi:uncharacterized protein (UPF0335 family)
MARGLTQAQIVERIERLERAVNAIADQAGVEIEDPSEGVDEEVVRLARAGKAMDAAKLHSERTGVSFVEAQRIVNDL